MTTTRLTAAAIGLAAMYAGGVAAQTPETHPTTKTKIEIKGGKDVTVIGCVEQRSNGGYVLTPVRDTGRGPLTHAWYALVTSQDLSPHVGERVEIRGKAVASGDGKASDESKIKAEHATDRETSTKAQGTSGTIDLPLLGVRSMKTLSSCN
jgi:hypothetical protein